MKPSNEATKSNAGFSLLFGKSDVIVGKSLVMRLVMMVARIFMIVMLIQ